MRTVLFSSAALIFSIFSCTPKLYTYEVTVPVGAHPSELLSFRPTGYHGDADADVFCTVIDLESGEPMSNTVVIFTKLSAQTALAGITTENGTFRKKLPADAYNLEVRYTGKNSFRLSSYTLDAGREYEIKIGLGDSGIPARKVVKSRHPLTQEEAEQEALKADRQ